MSLVFGPRNGPEDFSKFGYRAFRRKLFKTRFLFVDDVCVATGKGLNNEAVPGTEVARWLEAQPTSEERKKLEGLGKEFPADPSPYAHVLVPQGLHTEPVVMIPTSEFEVYDDTGWLPLDPPLNFRLRELMERHLHDPTYHS